MKELIIYHEHIDSKTIEKFLTVTNRIYSSKITEALESSDITYESLRGCDEWYSIKLRQFLTSLSELRENAFVHVQEKEDDISIALVFN